jgi:radical SAM protein with 4Fe4S-binding SPASM domain
MNLEDTVDVAFMFPPGGRSRYFEHHLGMAYIQAFLDKHGYKSKQVIPPAGSTLEECGELLIATDAPIIGFSCYDSNCYLIRFLTSYIKRKRPSTVIIVGGPTATFSDEIILSQIPEIDIVVRFEGEIATLELVSHILKGTPLDCLDDIKGISFRRNGSIVRTSDRPLFFTGTDKEGELDGLPSPYLEGILDGTEGAGILTARGCTHRCTYCNCAAMSRHTIRFHSIDRIINELKVIQSTLAIKPAGSATPQVINDDAFTLNTQRAKKICRQIIKEGFRLKLSCLCRADTLDEELVLLLKQAGFIDISFGLESAVPEVLRNIKKVCSIPQKSKNEDYILEKLFLSKVKEGISLAKKYNMDTAVSIILGIPGETFDQCLQTIEFVRRLNVDYYLHNFLGVYPGTEIFNKASDYGINVNFSDPFLRYETTPAYPVSKIPYLRNSSVYAEGQTVAQTLLRTFAGGRTLKSISGGGVTSALVMTSNSTELSNSFKWLSHILAVDGNVFVFMNENTGHDELDRIIHASSATFLPTERRYILRTLSDNTAEVIYKMHEGKAIEWKFQFPLVQLTKYPDFVDKLGQTNIEVFPLFYLKERTDVNVLSAVSEISALETEHSKAPSNFWLNGVFLDGCRWSRSVCPALELKQIIITESGEILPCTTGQTLGAVGDSIQELRKRTQNLYNKLRNDRKCDECPVDSWCAKCLFPYPLSPQEYCEVQRKSSNIAGIVISSKLANTYYILND